MPRAQLIQQASIIKYEPSRMVDLDTYLSVWEDIDNRGSLDTATDH